jgi:hypothetical protein
MARTLGQSRCDAEACGEARGTLGEDRGNRPLAPPFTSPYDDHLSCFVPCSIVNSLLILTTDEDDDLHNNQITTLFVGAGVKPGQYSEPITHLNVLRTVEAMYHLPFAGGSASAAPIPDVWAGHR